MPKLVGGHVEIGTGADVGNRVSEKIETPEIKGPDVGVKVPETEEGETTSPSGVRRPNEVVKEVFSEAPKQTGSILDKIGNDIAIGINPVKFRRFPLKKKPAKRSLKKLLKIS